jgi:hypothetical protein
MKKIWLTVLAIVLAGFWFLNRPMSAGGGDPIDWTREPVQTATDRAPFEVSTRKGPVTLHPVASFEVAGVVAGAERYRFDHEAFLSPVDFVLTWGDLPAEPYKSKVSYRQMTRYYFWRTPSSDLDPGYIQSHSSNMHMIPASANLKRALTSVGEGDSVRIRGLLVNVTRGDGYHWNSSRSRRDSGPGACELIWVEELQAGRKLYR